MNRVFVVGTGLCPSIPEHDSRPEFRKATRNMRLAHGSLTEAKAPLTKWIEESGTDQIGFVLATSHGELPVTMEFLKTLADTGMARPILFQNSLHNSTAGFLAMIHKLTGPMLTVSHLFLSGEDALSSGQLLLQQSQCHFCLVTAVESQVPALMPDGEKPGLNGTRWSEGSASVLLSDEWGLHAAELTPIVELLSVRSLLETGDRFKALTGHESDGIEKWVHALRTGAGESLRLTKPDGTASEIEWRR